MVLWVSSDHRLIIGRRTVVQYLLNLMFSPSRLMHGSFKRGRADKQQSRCKDDCLPGALPGYIVFHAHATCTLSKPRTRWRAPETTHNDDERGVKGNIGASREARRVFLALGNPIEEFKQKSL